MENDQSSQKILTAIRLGWLTVELFGRMRRFERGGGPRAATQGDASRRFDFSDNELSRYEAILLAVERLHRMTARLGPDLAPPPLPVGEELTAFVKSKPDLDSLQGQLDTWAREVWLILSTEDATLGRSFSYGGRLADTYWYTDVLGLERFAELLQPYRLAYIAARFDGIAQHLPPFTAHVLHYTLHKWAISDKVQGLTADDKRRTLRRLESQAKVWHDLLFGDRSAQSYLTPQDRRWVSLVGAGGTALLVLAAMGLVWLGVIVLSSAGLVVTASMGGLSDELQGAQRALVIDLLDWQKWSALLAAFSSLVVLLTGLIGRLSGWVLWFHQQLTVWLLKRFIFRRTYRHFP